MQKWMRATIAAVLVTASAQAAESFSRTLSPSDFSAAGLDRLTPAELAKLDALIGSRIPETNRSITSTALPLSGQTEKPERASSPPTTPPVESKTSLLQRAKVLLTPGTEIEYAAMDSELADPFRGWEKGTVLRLTNGQRWVVTEGHYATPPVKGPVRVRVVPGALGSFFMEIEGGGKPRVKILSKAP